MKTFSTRLELELDTETAKRIREIAYEVGAFLEGEVVLSSGLKSDRYFSGKKITSVPEGAYKVGKAIFDELIKVGVDAVGGLVTGAYPIVTAVALVSYLEGRPIPSFTVREEPKEHGDKRRIEGHTLQAGSRVAIVDDVITTGGSLIKAIEAVEEANCQVVKVVVLVDRHEGGSDKLRRMGYDFIAVMGYPAAGKVTIEQSSAATG